MARAVIFGLAGARLSQAEAEFFRSADPWGFILFGRNIEDRDQLSALTDELRTSVGRDAPILIDQEGGRVARMTAPHWTEFPNALEQMAINPALDAVRLRYRIIGAELRQVGIDVNCAPVLDIARDGTHPVLKSRCFGHDPKTVARAGRACAEGLLQSGVLPVIKHMPGQGLGTVDSHVGLPAVEADIETLTATDFAPFRSMRDMPMAMTSHVVFRAIDDVVATFSSAVVSRIRADIGFDGLLMTDDLSMGALDGSHAERASRALRAGCDMILHCSGDMEVMQEIAGVVDNLADDGLRRANAAINSRPPQDIVDIEELMAEYAAMMSTDS